ncbi:hypothetical protein ACMXYW_04665 [Neptuniibacter sp. QD48_55]|uniref:hypothetical protein n=1 Tax=Neptuniibacter sp. QD48_55 TaxID=3398212 RepID=UPI0039F478BA
MFDVFDNASVSAFIGAFSAFLLVVITDRRRLYRRRSILKNVISDNGELARFKLDSVERNLKLVAQGQISDAPIMAFPTSAVQGLQFEVVDVLDANQNQGVSVLLYWMSSIDAQIKTAEEKAAKVKTLQLREPESKEKLILFQEYREILEESAKNLEHLNILIQHYVSGRPEKIQEFSHE